MLPHRNFTVSFMCQHRRRKTKTAHTITKKKWFTWWTWSVSKQTLCQTRSVAVLPGSEKKKHQLTCPCGHSTPVAPLLQSEESPGWLRLLLHTTACWGREVLQRLQGGEGWKHTVERRGRGLDDRKRPPPPTNKLQCWYILTQHMERCSYFEFFEFVLFFKEKIVFNEQNTLLVS